MKLGTKISGDVLKHVIQLLLQNNYVLRVREVLNNLPDAEETLVIGALRSLAKYVQRRIVRDAIMTVDPEGAASRRTLSIVR